MNQALPDPLALWLRASQSRHESLDDESTLGALLTLWRNQEDMLRTLAKAFGHAAIAELAVQQMLEPMRRQARLLARAKVPNPAHVAVMDVALGEWMVAQAGVAQLAARDMEAAGCGSNASVLKRWVQAFAEQQQRYLSSEEGRRCFVQLSRAWSGLGFEPSAREGTGPVLRSLGGDGEPLAVIAPPWCQLSAFESLEEGLLAQLCRHYQVQLLDWGDTAAVDSLASLQARVAPVVQSIRVLDLSAGVMSPPSKATTWLQPAVSQALGRWRQVQGAGSAALFSPYVPQLPGELLAVLSEALYPEWPVSAWLAEQGRPSAALAAHNRYLDSLPALSAGLFHDVLRQQSVDSEGLTDQRLPSLLQVLSGACNDAMIKQLADA